MTVTVFGNGTVTGISAGGLPDGCIQSADIATGTIQSGDIASGVLPAGGKVLQIQSVFGGADAYSTTASTWTVCGSTRTITMSSTSNKILIMACGNLYLDDASSTYPVIEFSVRRTVGASTTNNVTDKAAFYYDARSGAAGRNQEQTPATTLGLDAPNSIAELTYQCEFRYVGMGATNFGVVAPISIVLMEVDVS